MIATEPGVRRLKGPPAAFVALLLVAPAIPLLGFLAATGPTLALALAVGAAVMVALLSNLTLGVCIFVDGPVRLADLPCDALTKVLGIALVARWLVEVAYPNPAHRLKSFARQYPVMTALRDRVTRLLRRQRALGAGSGRGAQPRPALRAQHRAARDRVRGRAQPGGASLDRHGDRLRRSAHGRAPADRRHDHRHRPPHGHGRRRQRARHDAGREHPLRLPARRPGAQRPRPPVLRGRHRTRLLRPAADELARRHARDGRRAARVGRRRRPLARPARLRDGHRPRARPWPTSPSSRRRRSALRVEEVIGVGTQHVDRSGTGRTSIWAVGVRAFKAHPLQGSGYGNYQTVSPALPPDGARPRGVEVHPASRSWRTTPTSSPWWRSASWAAFSSSRRPPARSCAFLLAARRFRRSRQRGAGALRPHGLRGPRRRARGVVLPLGGPREDPLDPDRHRFALCDLERPQTG